MSMTETPETQAMLDEMDRLTAECDMNIYGILEHGIKCGNVKPEIMQASHEIQEAWAYKLSPDYRAKCKRIHNLNLQWNIAHGLY